MSVSWTRALALALPVALIPLGKPEAADVVVRIEGVRNTKGLLRVTLFRSADGFPDRADLAADTVSLPAAEVVEHTFDGLEPGPWAVIVLHDENTNGKLDRNFLRIPREGVGATNNRLGNSDPKFEDARVEVAPEGGVLSIRMKYW